MSGLLSPDRGLVKLKNSSDARSRLTFHPSRFTFYVLLLAFAVRVYGLGWHGMTYDEAASVAFALPDVGHIVTYPQQAIYESPPVFYLVLHFWQALAGQSQFALRFLSVCFSVLQVPLVYQLGRRLFNPLVGLLAALVGAASVIQVYYAQEVRMYSLVPLLSLAATYILLRLIGDEGRRREADVWSMPRKSRITFYVLRFTSYPGALWAMYVITATLSILGHYYAGLVLIFHNLYALVAWRRGRVSLGTWAGVQALTLAGPLLYLAFASGVTTTVANIAGGGDVTNNLPRLPGLWLDFALGNVSTTLRRSPLTWALLALVLLGLALSVFDFSFRILDWRSTSLKSKIRNSKFSEGGLFLALYLLVPLALALALPYRLAPRYLLTLAPAYYLAIGVGLAALRPVWPVLVFGLGIVLGTSGYTLDAYRHIVKNDYQELTAIIEAQEQPGDVIILSGPRQHLLLRYYYHGHLPFRPVPLVDLPPAAEVDAPRLDPARTEADLPVATAGAHRVWLLLAGEDETDPDNLAERWLNGHTFFEFETRVQRGRLRLYEFPAVGGDHGGSPLRPVGGQFDAMLALADIGLPETVVQAGDHLHVELGWRVLADLPSDLKFTLRLLDGTGERVAQRDDRIAGGYTPPAGRPTGTQFVDYLSLPIPPNLPPGQYRLAVGLYLESASRDLPWIDPSGEPSGTLAPLGEVEVRSPSQSPLEVR